MSITLLDFIVIGVMLISALLAMVRGFTREVLSIASWVAAAAATLYFLPQVKEWARATTKLNPPVLSDIAAGAGIFVVTLIIVSLITTRIADLILDSRIGPIDRALGFVYGAARGLLLVVVAFLFFVWLVPDKGQPVWVAKSQSKPILEASGQALLALLPDDPEATILKRLKDQLPGAGGGDNDATEVPDAAPQPQVTPAAPAARPVAPGRTQNDGYRSAERQTMQRLLETTAAPATAAR